MFIFLFSLCSFKFFLSVIFVELKAAAFGFGSSFQAFTPLNCNRTLVYLVGHGLLVCSEGFSLRARQVAQLYCTLCRSQNNNTYRRSILYESVHI